MVLWSKMVLGHLVGHMRGSWHILVIASGFRPLGLHRRRPFAHGTWMRNWKVNDAHFLQVWLVRSKNCWYSIGNLENAFTSVLSPTHGCFSAARPSRFCILGGFTRSCSPILTLRYIEGTGLARRVPRWEDSKVWQVAL